MSLKIKTFDLSLVLIPIIFISVSVPVIYSLLMGTASDSLWLKQGIIGIIGLILMVGISFIDYRIFKSFSWIFYLISALLLLGVEFFGTGVNGAVLWLDLGFFRLEPCEIAKIGSILFFGSFFSSRIGRLKWRDIIVSLIYFLPLLFLVLRAPDLGTVAVICFVYFIMLITAKPNKKQWFAILGSLAVLVLVFTFSYLRIKPFQSVFKDYQRQRIAVFLHPDQDPLKSGYNVRQAQITVGSGGIFGRGLGKGSQTQLQWLPEAHTDFIFAGISESFGFFGSVTLLILYCFLILRILNVGYLAQDNFGMIVSFGIAAMFLFQVLVSVGMNVGLLPVTGIPLPFLSYGGTSLLISLFSLGIAESIFVRHKKITF